MSAHATAPLQFHSCHIPDSPTIRIYPTRSMGCAEPRGRVVCVFMDVGISPSSNPSADGRRNFRFVAPNDDGIDWYERGRAANLIMAKRLQAISPRRAERLARCHEKIMEHGGRVIPLT